MSVQNQNTLHGLVLVDSDGSILGRQGIRAVTRTGAGVYTVELEQPLADGTRIVGVQAEQGWSEYAWLTDTTAQVETFDNLLVATDQRFTFEVHRLPTQN